MGHKNQSIRVTNAIKDKDITLFVQGDMFELRTKTKKTTLKLDANAAIQLIEHGGKLLGHLQRVIEAESKQVFRQVMLGPMSTFLFPLNDCKHISVYTKRQRQNEKNYLCMNMPTKNLPKGLIWYEFEGIIRMGELQQDQRFKMKPQKSGMYVPIEDPLRILCQKCKNGQCVGNCSKGQKKQVYNQEEQRMQEQHQHPHSQVR